jgi:cytochrome c oxidase assembly factor CtaG
VNVALATSAILVGTVAWYARAWRRADDAGAWHLASLLVAVLAVAVAQIPLFALAEERSAVAHVALLILVIHAAPFFLLRSVTPGILGRYATPIAGFATRLPVLVPLVLLAVVAYGWHVPAAFDAAARNAALGTMQHLTFLLVGTLAWLPIAAHAAFRPRLLGLSAFLYLVGDELILGALGIVLTWAPRPLYDVYLDAPRLWGLSADTDQMLAGAVLTVVEEAPMGVALAVVFIRMLQREEAELQAEERALDLTATGEGAQHQLRSVVGDGVEAESG